MHSYNVPACLVKQAAQGHERAFLPVEENQHLSIKGIRKRASTAQIRKQGVGRNGQLSTRDFVRGGVVAGIRYMQFTNDQLRLRPSSGSQVLQDFDAVFIRPIVNNYAEEEDSDVFIPRWLRFEEIVALQLHASRLECVGHVLLPVVIGIVDHSLAVLYNEAEVGVVASKC